MKKLLVGCEWSGKVSEAFRARGWEAWSCDLREGVLKEWYLRGDVTEVIRSKEWDMIILHPPCTALAISGNRTYAGSPERAEALRWTKELWDLARSVCPKVALEQPRSVLGQAIGRMTQSIHPWQFGHDVDKTTWLWLHGLPKLVPTEIIPYNPATLYKARNWCGSATGDRQLKRSITFDGIANAMAKQWG